MIDILTNVSHDSATQHSFLVIAYYTVDTPYEGEAEVLKLSLESMGYSYLVCGVPNLGSWQKNTQMKAEFISLMLEEMPGQPLLYLDVDAIMVQAPLLLDGLQTDVAAVHFAGRSELLSGTLFLGGTPLCGQVVQRWRHLNGQYPDTLPNGKPAWDQRTLAMAIKGTPGVKFVELPQEYTWITELTQKHQPGLAPVILHTRGAKRFKRLINGQKGFAT
jgi:hypothetical protein